RLVHISLYCLSVCTTLLLCLPFFISFSFSFCIINTTSISHIYTLSLHDALPILKATGIFIFPVVHLLPWSIDHFMGFALSLDIRSEEHTSELQSRFDLVCRLLLEKKKN